MAREFKETAHTKTDMNKYGENYDRIFNKELDRMNTEIAKFMVEFIIDKDKSICEYDELLPKRMATKEEMESLKCDCELFKDRECSLCSELSVYNEGL